MVRTGSRLLIFLLILLPVAAGCSNNPPGQSNSPGGRTGPDGDPPPVPSVSDAPDTLPLLPIMIQLERDMNAISGGIWREDYDRIARGARNIAQHPKIPKRQLQTIRSILGPKEFKAFVRDDKRVHRRSVELKVAAEDRNFEDVTRLYLELERGCISCHAKHRGTIRSSDRW